MSMPFFAVQAGRTLAPASPAAAIALTADPVRCLRGVLLTNDDGAAPNGSTGILYWGGPGVTDADGMPLRPGSSVSIPTDSTDGIYIVASDATTTVSWATV